MSRNTVARKPKDTIALPTSGMVSIPVERGEFSETFVIDFDDARKMRAFLKARQDILDRVEAVGNGSEMTGDEVADLYEAMWSDVSASIDMVLGDGASERIFSGSHAMFGALHLIARLAERIGPAYDAIFAGYKQP